MNKHGIKAATTLTGLSAHVIRVWEKRYQAVTPLRTDTNRRMYSDADITRLQTLSHLVGKGYSIGNIAYLKAPKLQQLVDSIDDSATRPYLRKTLQQSEEFVHAAARAIRDYDQTTLESIFDDAALSLGYSGLLELVVIPVINQVGDDWSDGTLTVACEHASTSFIKDYLSHSLRSFNTDENAPMLVVTTPSGQLHDLGAFIGACQARKLGWKIVFLGASLPAVEIASAVAKVNAAALLLSIVYPADDPDLGDELRQLRKLVPDRLPILVGGNALKNYTQPLKDTRAITIPSMSDLAPELHKIRSSRLNPASSSILASSE